MVIIETELDKMPNNCKECPYMREINKEYIIIKNCSVTGEYLEDDVAVNYKRTEKYRGFECPLKEV